MRKRDSQRSKVYTWERTLKDIKLSQNGSWDLIMRILTHYGEQNCAPIIKFRRSGRWAWGGANRISLPPFALTQVFVTHETVHCVVERLTRHLPESCAWHGPEFMRVYLHALNNFTDIVLSEESLSLQVAPDEWYTQTMEGWNNGRI